MWQRMTTGALLMLLCALSAYGAASEGVGRDRDFDADWRFHRGEAPGAEAAGFDDSAWRRVHVPHDWSIEDLPNQEDEGVIGPFSKESPGGKDTGHVIGGTGWYRKHFTLPETDAGKRVRIFFDGVYMDAEVWLNGHHLGNHPYGYTPFHFDLTPQLNAPGEENVLAVRVRNLGKNSRWYSGSGIYRDVTLTVTDPVHVAPWGVYITTPEADADKAIVRIATTLANDGEAGADVTLRTRLLGPDGAAVAEVQTDSAVQAGGRAENVQTARVPKPKRWSPESPSLYTAVMEVLVDGEAVDTVRTTFGIRTLAFSAEKGFLLNESPVLLRGGNLHHDNGPLGAAAFQRAEERRVEIMKANGFNALRASHNPPSAAFLDACDRLGMLVIDEAFDQWEHPKRPDDYSRFFADWHMRDLDAMLLRGRNHPSVIMWSIGNEIYERADPAGLAIGKRLAERVRELDPARPVTMGVCSFWQQPGRPWEDSAPVFALLDVGGYNYQWEQYEKDHAAFPDRVMCGTESFAQQAFENWEAVERLPYVIGDFVWTGMDYIGEASIGHAILDDQEDAPLLGWPWFNAYCGDIDLIGQKKPQSYYRDVVWGRSELEMAVHAPIPEGRTELVSKWGWPDEYQHWTWPGAEGKTLQVRVFSRCDRVRLELNGEPVGEKAVSKETKLTAAFDVPYAAGELKAIGLKDGEAVASKTFRTAGPPARIALEVDRAVIRASRSDLAYVTASLVDAQGVRVPATGQTVSFSVVGPGELKAVGNGNPTDMKSFQSPSCDTFKGRCLAILRPTGESGTMELRARVDGLPESVCEVRVE